MRNVSVSAAISEFATGKCDGKIHGDYPHHIEHFKILEVENHLKRSFMTLQANDMLRARRGHTKDEFLCRRKHV